MSEQVWVCRGHADGAINIPFRDPDTQLTIRERVRLANNVKRGLSVDPALLPSRLVFDGPNRKLRTVVHNVFTDGYMYVAEPVMQIISEFNIGKTHFFPVSLFDKELNSITFKAYFGIAFSEAKRTVSGGQALIENGLQPGEFNLDSPLLDGAVEVFPNLTEEPDIWVDPNIIGAVFMSDRLHNALQAAGLVARFSARKCLMPEQ